MANPLETLDRDRLFGPAPEPAAPPDPFGRIGAGDPEWERVREAWMGGATLRDMFGDRVFDLNGTVGTGQANQRGDVFKLQALLHREGVLNAAATGGPTGYWGNRDDAALRDLQKQNDLTVDGWAGPRGETMNWLRDLYRPPQGLQVSDAEIDALQQAQQDRDALRRVNSDLAKTLQLDLATLDLDSEDTLRALGATRFYQHLNRHDQYKAMRDIERMQQENPQLVGRLRGKIAESIANPVWQIPLMTPERLVQARAETEDGLKMMRVIELLTGGGKTVWKRYGKSAGGPKIVGPGLGIFKWGTGQLREGFQKTLDEIDAEMARRAAP